MTPRSAVRYVSAARHITDCAMPPGKKVQSADNLCKQFGLRSGLPGPVAQSVTSRIADPGVVSSIPAQPHTFAEIDHKIFSKVILLLVPIQEGLYVH